MFESGKFFVGANYWASHAGTAMWKNWKLDVVEADLKRLSDAGIEVLRVFPLWSDFQPITQMYGGGGHRVEIRLGENPLPDDGPGAAGVDPVMLERFAKFADAAAKNKIRLIVGLVTGWMSGRLFMPPALEGRNPITDPLTIQWEVRFVRAFVRHFKNHPAIASWDLGNECNCMGPATREEAWLWTASIANAIRVEDASREVVSGMHSLPVNPSAPWSIRDQGELTDILCTHPYPHFTPHVNLDPVGSVRTSLHAAAETRLYTDIGRKPGFIEEAGTLGPGYGDAVRAGAHLRTMLFSGWMEDLRGLLWWCAFDQTHLEHAPYDWNAVERELGLLAVDGSVKPFAKEMKAFQKFRQSLPFTTLSKRQDDALVILGPDQDQWGAAFGSFILASQAGVSVRFAWGEDDFPDSRLYVLPSTRGARGIPRRSWMNLLKKIQAGATLYLSVENDIIAELERMTGLEVIHRSKRTEPLRAEMKWNGETISLSCETPVKTKLRATRAEVWANEADGNPAIACASYGKGKIVTSFLPFETALLARPGLFQSEPAAQLWQRIAETSDIYRILQKKSFSDVITSEHIESDARRYAIVYNASDAPATYTGSLQKNWKAELVSVYPEIKEEKNAADRLESGDKYSVRLEPWSAAVLRLTQ